MRARVTKNEAASARRATPATSLSTACAIGGSVRGSGTDAHMVEDVPTHRNRPSGTMAHVYADVRTLVTSDRHLGNLKAFRRPGRGRQRSLASVRGTPDQVAAGATRRR